MKTKKAMATRPALKRRVAKASKDDLHVKIADAGNAPEVTTGEGGRYLYGIVEAKEQMTFGKIGIGGAGELVTL